MCWYQLYDFHTFYINVKNVHEQNNKFNVTEHNTTEIKTCHEVDDADENCMIYTIDDVIENIDQEDEQLLAVMAVNDSVTFERPTKRKRGRPRKNEIVTEKSKPKWSRPHKYNVKRKRGRPRKYVNGMLTPKMIKAAGIKRPVGRPSKNKNINPITDTTNNELPVLNAAEETLPNVPNKIKIEKTEDEEFISEDLAIQRNDNSESEDKILKLQKLRIYEGMKKRKKSQQHKALMRNYIATSVHCMEFFKK